MSQSAIYEGTVCHRRLAPLRHAFRYRLFMAYLDLDELPTVLDGCPGWSARRPALAWFRRGDHLGDPAIPLRRAVGDLVEQRTGRRPDGPVRVLTNLRYLGHCFNPVTFYFCFDRDGRQVDAVVAEVTNTPWGERHGYVLARGETRGPVLREQLDKRLHVSPLMGMDHVYDFRVDEPGEGLQVHITNRRRGEAQFEATLSLRRHELTPSRAARTLARYPLMCAQVVARIYLQALVLRLKGARYHPHPEQEAARP